jgi:quinol-cytochrome oxidoreductase complex cytochrome b subunit
MKTNSHSPKLHYHTWKDLGGPIGFILDFAFFGFVLVAAFFMMVFCSVLLLLDYLSSPILAFMSRLQTRHAA